MSSSAAENAPLRLAGVRVTIVGELAVMPRRAARKLLAERGAQVVDQFDRHVTLVVVGERSPPSTALSAQIAETAIDPAAVRIVGEADLWRRLEVVDSPDQFQRYYTPAMMAELLGVQAAVIRRWQRRGLIVPVREIHQLPYFDFHEVQTARHLAQLSREGASPAEIERQVVELRRARPAVERPLADLPVVIDGGKLLLRRDDGLVEACGQRRFDFADDAVDSDAAMPTIDLSPLPSASDDLAPSKSPEQLRNAAAACDEAGRLRDAADFYRAALASGGPDAETCFLLADVLYRLGDSAAARERYFMAVELNDDFVEARASLGCLLAEEGRLDLAVAALEGALRFHDAYPDVHYHLARTLDEIGRSREAERHWAMFLELAPGSPWAADAHRRLSAGNAPAGD